MTEAPPWEEGLVLEDSLDLTTAADDGCLDLGHDLVERLWSRHEEIPPPARMRFELSIMEVLNNVVEHAFDPVLPEQGPVRQEVTIGVGITDEGLYAVVSDNGDPPSIDLSETYMPEPEAEGGRGLAMAGAMTSSFTVQRIDQHNVWRLRCELT